MICIKKHILGQYLFIQTKKKILYVYLFDHVFSSELLCNLYGVMCSLSTTVSIRFLCNIDGTQNLAINS
jgi:hypothetical protein